MLHPDSRLIRFLTRVCDLLFLNILLLLSCVTVVFSGAAIVSLYAVTLKMIRKEDCPPVKGFLRGLRENFIPSVPAAILLFTDITLIAVLITVLYAEALVVSPPLLVLLTIAAVLLTALLSYLFPLSARFENTFPKHLGNAARLALANLPVTFLLASVNLLPLLVVLFAPSLSGPVIVFWSLLGFSAGAYLNSFYLNRIFGKISAGRGTP